MRRTLALIAGFAIILAVVALLVELLFQSAFLYWLAYSISEVIQ